MVTRRIAGQPSTHILQVRLTPDEHDATRTLAAHVGETISDMVRRLINDERERRVIGGKRSAARGKE